MCSRYAIILCGGSGTRLWPLSRTLRPKQLLPLNGEQTLLQQTALRLNKFVSANNLITVTHVSHRYEVKGQLSEVLPDAVNGLMAEPCARNTLPAIAWAVSKIYIENPAAVIGVFASDHSIDNQAAFLNAWQTAEIAANQGYLTLLGVTPTEPATGYGYIQPEAAIDIGSTQLKVHKVAKFVEKPNRELAEQFVDQGYLWNSGMFVFRADVFMQMLQHYQPEIAAQINSLNAPNISDERLAEFYQALPNISMDYGLAEKADKVAVVPVDMSWSDLGSWNSIYQRHAKDENHNVAKGEVVLSDTQDSLLWNEHGMLAVLGVKNLAVIQTPDATLICDRSRTEEIKQLVADVRLRQPELIELHRTVYRPWGNYTVLEEGENFKIKRIVVNAGAKLSMQMHQHRSEHWVVVSGEATINNGAMHFTLNANESTFIPKTHKHRLANIGTQPLVIIEVQCGEYVGEDDIIRFEDNYGRVPV